MKEVEQGPRSQRDGNVGVTPASIVTLYTVGRPGAGLTSTNVRQVRGAHTEQPRLTSVQGRAGRNAIRHSCRHGVRYRTLGSVHYLNSPVRMIRIVHSSGR